MFRVDAGYPNNGDGQRKLKHDLGTAFRMGTICVGMAIWGREKERDTKIVGRRWRMINRK